VDRRSGKAAQGLCAENSGFPCRCVRYNRTAVKPSLLLPPLKRGGRRAKRAGWGSRQAQWHHPSPNCSGNSTLPLQGREIRAWPLSTTCVGRGSSWLRTQTEWPASRTMTTVVRIWRLGLVRETMRKSVFLAALTLEVRLWPAHASEFDLVRFYGLLGTWAPNCSSPPSSENPYERFAITDKKITINTELGNNLRSTSDMRYLATTRSGMLSFTQMLRPAERGSLGVAVQKAAGKLRTWSSVSSAGKQLIEDGRFAETGRAVPWLEKCKE